MAQGTFGAGPVSDWFKGKKKEQEQGTLGAQAAGNGAGATSIVDFNKLDDAGKDVYANAYGPVLLQTGDKKRAAQAAETALFSWNAQNQDPTLRAGSNLLGRLGISTGLGWVQTQDVDFTRLTDEAEKDAYANAYGPLYREGTDNAEAKRKGSEAVWRLRTQNAGFAQDLSMMANSEKFASLTPEQQAQARAAWDMFGKYGLNNTVNGTIFGPGLLQQNTNDARDRAATWNVSGNDGQLDEALGRMDYWAQNQGADDAEMGLDKTKVPEYKALIESARSGAPMDYDHYVQLNELMNAFTSRDLDNVERLDAEEYREKHSENKDLRVWWNTIGKLRPTHMNLDILRFIRDPEKRQEMLTATAEELKEKDAEDAQNKEDARLRLENAPDIGTVQQRFDSVFRDIGSIDSITDPVLRERALALVRGVDFRQTDPLYQYTREELADYGDTLDTLEHYRDVQQEAYGTPLRLYEERYPGLTEAMEAQGYTPETFAELTEEAKSSMARAYQDGGAEGVAAWDAEDGEADRLYEHGKLWREENDADPWEPYRLEANKNIFQRAGDWVNKNVVTPYNETLNEYMTESFYGTLANLTGHEAQKVDTPRTDEIRKVFKEIWDIPQTAFATASAAANALIGGEIGAIQKGLYFVKPLMDWAYEYLPGIKETAPEGMEKNWLLNEAIKWTGFAAEDFRGEAGRVGEEAKARLNSLMTNALGVKDEDAQEITDIVIDKVTVEGMENLGNQVPYMLCFWAAGGTLPEAGKGILNKVISTTKSPAFFQMYMNQTGSELQDMYEKKEGNVTDLDVGLCYMSGYINSLIEIWPSSHGSGFQSLLSGMGGTGFGAYMMSGFQEMKEEVLQRFTEYGREDLADAIQGKPLTHKLDTSSEDSLFNVAQNLDLMWETWWSSTGMFAATGAGNRIGNRAGSSGTMSMTPYKDAVTKFQKGEELTPEERVMVRQAAMLGFLGEETDHADSDVTTPDAEGQHDGFEAGVKGEEAKSDGVDHRAEQAAAEQAEQDGQMTREQREAEAQRLTEQAAVEAGNGRYEQANALLDQARALREGAPQQAVQEQAEEAPEEEAPAPEREEEATEEQAEQAEPEAPAEEQAEQAKQEEREEAPAAPVMPANLMAEYRAQNDKVQQLQEKLDELQRNNANKKHLRDAFKKLKDAKAKLSALEKAGLAAAQNMTPEQVQDVVRSESEQQAEQVSAAPEVRDREALDTAEQNLREMAQAGEGFTPEQVQAIVRNEGMPQEVEEELEEEEVEEETEEGEEELYYTEDGKKGRVLTPEEADVAERLNDASYKIYQDANNAYDLFMKQREFKMQLEEELNELKQKKASYRDLREAKRRLKEAAALRHKLNLRAYELYEDWRRANIEFRDYVGLPRNNNYEWLYSKLERNYRRKAERYRREDAKANERLEQMWAQQTEEEGKNTEEEYKPVYDEVEDTEVESLFAEAPARDRQDLDNAEQALREKAQAGEGFTPEQVRNIIRNEGAHQETQEQQERTEEERDTRRQPEPEPRKDRIESEDRQERQVRPAEEAARTRNRDGETQEAGVRQEEERETRRPEPEPRKDRIENEERQEGQVRPEEGAVRTRNRDGETQEAGDRQEEERETRRPEPKPEQTDIENGEGRQQGKGAPTDTGTSELEKAKEALDRAEQNLQEEKENQERTKKTWTQSGRMMVLQYEKLRDQARAEYERLLQEQQATASVNEKTEAVTETRTEEERERRQPEPEPRPERIDIENEAGQQQGKGAPTATQSAELEKAREDLERAEQNLQEEKENQARTGTWTQSGRMRVRQYEKLRDQARAEYERLQREMQPPAAANPETETEAGNIGPAQQETAPAAPETRQEEAPENVGPAQQEQATVTAEEGVDRTQETQRRQLQLEQDANRHAERLGFTKYTKGQNSPGVQIRTWDGEMSDVQRAELITMDAFARRTGFTIAVHSQLEGGMANGEYRGGRVIHIAQDSQNPLRTTMGHELYHMLTSLNPTGAQKVAGVFAKWADRNGYDVNEMISKIMVSYREVAGFRSLSLEQQRSYAYEEVVANSLLDVIGDQESARALALQDRNLMSRIRDWISRCMQQIHSMLANYAQNSEEARVLAGNEAALREMRETVNRALEETEALNEAKKAGKSLGSNSRMLEGFVKGLNEAQSFDEAHTEAQKLAASILRQSGLEATDQNLNAVLGAATLVADGTMISEAVQDTALAGQLKFTPEINRAMAALGRYQQSLMRQGLFDEYERLYEKGQAEEEEGKEEQQPARKEAEKSQADEAIETVSKREGKNADMVKRVSNEARGTDGKPLYSLKSMQHDIDIYKKMMRDSGAFSEREISDLFNTIEKAMQTIEAFSDILDLNEKGGKEVRAFNPIKPNSDALYKVSLDFSTLCRKRLLQQSVQEAIERKYKTVMSKAERIAMANALKQLQKEGLKIEIACALCYVESARLKSPEQIRRFMADKRGYIIDYLSKTDKAYKQAIQQAADAKAAELGYEPGTSLKEMKKKDADAIREVKRKMYAEYQPTAEQEAMIREAEALDESMYKSAAGLEELKKKFPVIFDAYTTMVRNATKSKGLEADVPFYAYDTEYISDALIAAMNKENGLRSQSWSDFQVIHLLDYMGAIIELSIRGAKMQAYTKVTDYVRLMGQTGQMINLSLIPMAYNGMRLEFDPKEGMDFESAQQLREQYPDTVGNICIGISDDHIRALIRAKDANGVDLIDYVIGYHKSGMDKASRKRIGLLNWKDYEAEQNEKNREYDTTVHDEYYHKHLNFSDWYSYQEAKALADQYKAQGMSTYEASKAAMDDMARRYIETCHRRGLQEKFAAFSNESGYWKLLIDRKMINQVTGELIEQKAVRPVFDSDVIQDILKREVERVRETQPDMDAAVTEMLRLWENGEIQRAARSKDVKAAVKATEENFIKNFIVESSEAEQGTKLSLKDTRTQDQKADEEKMLLETETDAAGNDNLAWDLIAAIRDIKKRTTQNEDGGQEVTKGTWKKDLRKIAESLERDTSSSGMTKQIMQRLTEMYESLDDFEGSDQAWLDHALQTGKTLAADILLEQEQAYRDSVLEEAGESGRQALRDYFRGGYWYISKEAKAYVEQYIGPYAEFRKTMSANGIRVTTVEGAKRSGTSYDLEHVWKPGDESGLYEKLGGEQNDTVGDMLQKAYDAVTRGDRNADATLTQEEYNLAGRIGISLVADYLQAGDRVITTHSVEKIDDQRHRETVAELDRLKKETDEQRNRIEEQSKEIDRQSEEIEQLRSTVSKEITRYSDLSRQMRELKENNAPAEEIAKAKEELKAAMQEKTKAQNRKDAALKKLDEQKNELKDLRAQLRKTERARDRAMSKLEDVKERKKEALKALREQLREKYKAEYKERIEKAKARQKATKERTKHIDSIRRTGARMKTWLASPSTNRGYFQEQNAAAAADLVEALMAHDGRKSAAQMSRKLEEAIRKARDSGEYLASQMFDSSINDTIHEVTKMLEDKGSLRNLSDGDLAFLDKILTTIVKQVETANETVGREKNRMLAEESDSWIRTMQENPRNLKGPERQLRKLVQMHLNPQRFFSILSHHQENAVSRIGQELSEGQRKQNMLAMKMTKVFQDLTEGANEKAFDEFTGKKAHLIDTGIKILDDQGNETERTWKMSGAMRAFFGLSWLADENREGMRAGINNEHGAELYQMTVPDEELLKKGKEKEAYAVGVRVYFTEAQADQIVDDLTDYEKAWMTAWREMEKLSKSAINEVSMLLNGFKKAEVDNYVPIFRDPRYIGKEFETVVTDSRLTSMGFLKDRVNAHNPMMLMDLVNVINRQVRDVSAYYGLAVPARNATRIYNGIMPGYATSVKEVMNKTQGMEVGQYFENLMADLQGGNRVQSSILDKMRGDVAGATLAGNPSVIIKQAASYPAAAAVLGWSPLMKALKFFNPAGLKQIDVNDIDNYTSALWERRSRNLSDLEANAHRNTKMSKALHFLVNGIQRMDVATTTVIWKACEYYVDETNKNLQRGTEEYKQAVARVYEQALEQTQPEYGVMQRPEILRSKSQLVKSLTMYKTQSLQNFGILVDAFANLSDKRAALKKADTQENRAAYSQAKTGMARAMSSQIISAIVLALMTALGKALLHKPKDYMDEKGDFTAQSVGRQLLKDTGSSMAGMVVGGSEMFDLFMGVAEGKSPFDIEAAGISTINDLYQNTYALLDAAKVIGDSSMTDEQKMAKLWPRIRKLGLSVATAYGLPVGNFLNLTDGIAANAADLAAGKPGSFSSKSPLQIAGTPIIGSAQGRETSNAVAAGYIGRAMAEGNEAEAVRLYNEQLRQGKTPESLNSAIGTWQKENLPEVREAAEAIDRGDLVTYNEKINTLTHKGLSMANAVKYVEAARKKLTALDVEPEPDRAETPAGMLTYEEIVASMRKDESEQAYTNGMMNSLLEDGNLTAAIAIRDDMIANGKKASSINSSLTSYWKPRLQAAYEAGDMETVRNITKMLVEMGLKRTTIQGWTSGSTGSTSSSSTGFGGFGFSGFGSTKKKSTTKKSSGNSKSTFFGGSGFGSGGWFK